jgi:hypothetical protein
VALKWGAVLEFGLIITQIGTEFVIYPLVRRQGVRVLCCCYRTSPLIATPGLVPCCAVSQQRFALETMQFRQPQLLPGRGMSCEPPADGVERLAWAVE